MTARRIGSLALVLGLSTAAPSIAEDAITRQQADSILVELKAIRQLLERSLQQQPGHPHAAERSVRLPPVTTYKLGRSDAPLTLVEFTDYECPFCRQFHIATFEKLRKDYIETGKLRFISRDLPLDFHKLSFGAATAARCAGEQGKYWEMRHVLIVNADRLAPPALVTYAHDLGVDTTLFQSCMQGGKFAGEIRRDMEDAQKVAVTATPTFVLGKTQKVGFEGVVIVGAVPIETFEAKIRELLPPPR